MVMMSGWIAADALDQDLYGIDRMTPAHAASDMDQAEEPLAV